MLDGTHTEIFQSTPEWKYYCDAVEYTASSLVSKVGILDTNGWPLGVDLITSFAPELLRATFELLGSLRS